MQLIFLLEFLLPPPLKICAVVTRIYKQGPCNQLSTVLEKCLSGNDSFSLGTVLD
jgi:hypothetical protein